MTIYKRNRLLMHVMLIGLTALFCVNIGRAQGMDSKDDNSADRSPVQAGYAVVTPTSGSPAGLVVFETFGEHQGNGMTQAGVLPADMTTNSILFFDANGRLSKNLGVAIANPGSAPANVSITLRDDVGNTLATLPLTVAAGSQIAKFVTGLFSGQPNVPKDLTGTLQVKSDVPVAVIGVRFRGINFSTLPATSLSSSSPVPLISTGIGGAGAVILPQFATGGGWATEIVLVNSGTASLVVRVDLFTQSGLPLPALLNNTLSSSFTNIVIPAGGVVILAPKDDDDNDF